MDATKFPIARFGDGIIGAMIALAGTVLFAVVTGAWSSKESVSDHKADMQTMNNKLDRAMDAICWDRPTIPVCLNRKSE